MKIFKKQKSTQVSDKVHVVENPKKLAKFSKLCKVFLKYTLFLGVTILVTIIRITMKGLNWLYAK